MGNHKERQVKGGHKGHGERKSKGSSSIKCNVERLSGVLSCSLHGFTGLPKWGVILELSQR